MKVKKKIMKNPLTKVLCPICNGHLHVCWECMVPTGEVVKAYVECGIYENGKWKPGCGYIKDMHKTKEKKPPFRIKFDIDHSGIEEDREKEKEKPKENKKKIPEEKLRAIAKKLGIKYYWNKSVERLRKEVKEFGEEK